MQLRPTLLTIATLMLACQPPLSRPEEDEDTDADTQAARADASISQPNTADAGPLLDAGAGVKDVTSGAAPDAGALDPSTGDPHPAFSFAPSNVTMGQIDFSQAPAAALDCGKVQITSSTPPKFDNWCGDKPTTLTQKQTGGPDLLVIPLSNLTIEQGTTVAISGDRPVVFLVKGHVAIRGSLDASANGPTPGAGAGSNVDCASSAGGDGTGHEGSSGAGGGGGGFGTAGGAGATDGASSSKAGTAGTPRGSAQLVPLMGGCGGGYGGGCPGRRGAGGGALQISASGSISVSGTVRVDGGDGAPGCFTASGGTGGGSGGGLLLEAAQIDAPDGTLSAAGGSGGPGQSVGNPGAGATTPDAPGGDGTAAGKGAGAGGGGYGRIHVRTP